MLQGHTKTEIEVMEKISQANDNQKKARFIKLLRQNRC